MAHPFSQAYDSITTYVRKWVAGIMGAPSSLIYTYGNPEVYTEINQEKAICEGFEGNSAVYAIVMADAEKFGSIPRYVYDAKVKQEKSYEENIVENDLSKLLNRPNDGESQDAFFMKLRAYYKTCGEAFIWLNRGMLADDLGDDQAEKMPVLEMFVLPSNKVIIYPDDTLWGVQGYALDLGGQKMPLRKVDVIHWKSTSLGFDSFSKNQLRGFSPLTAGYKSLQQNNDATNAAVRMYQNDGAKGILSNESMDKLDAKQKSQIDEVVGRKINSSDAKGAVAVMQGKWMYHDIAKNSVDLELLKGKEMSMMELCFLMGVPYTMFDPNTAFANSEWQQKNWITNKIIPACRQLDGEFNRVLLKAFGLEGLAFIGSDFSELPEMQQDMAKLVTALKDAWWITPNQKLDMMNEEPSNDPLFDEPWIPTGINPLSQVQGDEQMMSAISDKLKTMGLNDESRNQAGSDE